MVDVALVAKKIAELRDRSRLLRSRKIRNFEEFQDPFLNNAVQHLLEVMVEICIDIGNHVIVDEVWPMPSSNREVF